MPDHAEPPITSHANINGHPIHPLIVPVPLTTLIGAFVADLFFLLSGRDPFWARLAFYLLIVGVVSGALAAVIGLVDFISIPRARALSIGWLHLGFNLGAVVLALVNIFLRLPGLVLSGSLLGAGVILSAIVTGLLLFSGWWGGELAYRHRIGVVSPRDVSDQPDQQSRQPAA